MTILNWDLEMSFDGGTTFTSVKSDVRIGENITAFWGNTSSGPLDRMAQTGTFQFVLNNAAISVPDVYSGMELLGNGGFETFGGSYIWANWYYGGDGAITNETTLVHSGNNAAKIVQGPSLNTDILYLGPAWECIPVVTGRRYRVSFWTQGDGTHAGRYNVVDSVTYNTITGDTSTGVSGVEYEQVVFYFTAPVGVTTVILILSPAYINGAIAYFDDISILAPRDFVGYYSPANTNARAGFGIGTEMRLKLVAPTVGTYYKKYYVSDINPEMGIHGSRAVRVGGIDYMGILQKMYIGSLLPVKLNRLSTDEVIYFAQTLLPFLPETVDSVGAGDTFAYLWQDMTPKTSAYQALNRLNQSGLSYLNCNSDATKGETLHFESRLTRTTSSSYITFTDSMIGLSLVYGTDKIYNDINVTCHPVNIGTTNEILYTLQSEMVLQSGATVSFDAWFSDPSAAGNRISLIDGTGVIPTADTDYKMSSISGNAGNDLNSGLTVTASYFGGGASVTLTSNAPITGYINLLHLRGHIIRLYDAVTSRKTDTAANLALYGQNSLNVDLLYQNDPSIAQDIANFLFTQCHLPKPDIDYLEFIANTSSALMDFASWVQAGTRITVSETVTGINKDYSVNGVEKTIEGGTILRVRLYLERTFEGSFWILEYAASQLGVNTYLAF